jgi:hypothetical protein
MSETNQVDPHEAPEGYYAVPSPEKLCFADKHDRSKDCAFFGALKGQNPCSKATVISCFPEDRKDGQEVLFYRKF